MNQSNIQTNFQIAPESRNLFIFLKQDFFLWKTDEKSDTVVNWSKEFYISFACSTWLCPKYLWKIDAGYIPVLMSCNKHILPA